MPRTETEESRIRAVALDLLKAATDSTKVFRGRERASAIKRSMAKELRKLINGRFNLHIFLSGNEVQLTDLRFQGQPSVKPADVCYEDATEGLRVYAKF